MLSPFATKTLHEMNKFEQLWTLFAFMASVALLPVVALVRGVLGQQVSGAEIVVGCVLTLVLITGCVLLFFIPLLGVVCMAIYTLGVLFCSELP